MCVPKMQRLHAGLGIEDPDRLKRTDVFFIEKRYRFVILVSRVLINVYERIP